MQTTGVIVEYNPFHNGHIYHVEQARKITGADCVIAIMSGSFLQRGEPAIIDKFHRTKAVLQSGVDMVVELPYIYAVQSSDLFAKGSLHTLNELCVDGICFGSESGQIDDFNETYRNLQPKKKDLNKHIQSFLNKGIPFPAAHEKAYEYVGLSDSPIDLTQPNNQLGYSYLQEIYDCSLDIIPTTITRKNSHYHDKILKRSISSATSIRRKLFKDDNITEHTKETMPKTMINQLNNYKHHTGLWHEWELYFTLLQYRVMTMSNLELSKIHGVIEGLEHRIKKTASNVTSMQEWIEAVKTKRYTWTRIQRIFAHILTHTKTSAISSVLNSSSIPYIRILGMNATGRAHLNHIKKEIKVPLYTHISRDIHPILKHEEQASAAYYSILPKNIRLNYMKQEIEPPIII